MGLWRRWWGSQPIRGLLSSKHGERVINFEMIQAFLLVSSDMFGQYEKACFVVDYKAGIEAQ